MVLPDFRTVATMNDEHIELLTSAQWQRYLQADLLPWAQSQIHLDCDATELLEVGPGPGQMTDLLRLLVQRLVAIEIDPALAHALSARLGGTNVEVICGDAIATDLSTDRFTGAVCFTMLHHIPSQALQDGLFAELHRVLRPGARLIGVDSLDSPALREFHCGDTFVPIDLETMAPRLRAAGFGDITVEVWEPPLRPGQKVRFAATKV
jgi:SAM-dependent methyltransferase